MLKEDQGITELDGIARDGSIYYSTFVSPSDVQVAQLEPASLAIAVGPTRFIDTFLGRNGNLSFSPDGKWIAWTSGPNREPAAPGMSVVVRAAAGGEEKVIPAIRNFRAWFPDSKALLNERLNPIGRGGDGQAIFERVEVQDGRTTELYRGDPLPFVTVAPDGNALLGLRCNAPRPCDLVRYDLRTKSETVETLSEISRNVLGTPIEISPDGKWMAVFGGLASGSGRGLFVRPTAGGKLVELVRETATEGFGQGLTWTHDSKQIIYAVTAPSQGIWFPQAFKAVPVGGGAQKIIPLKGSQPSLDPSGRLVYTVSSARSEIWLARNLLPSN